MRQLCVDEARARRARKRGGDRAEVTVVSEDNFLLFTPMLAEVAAGYLDPRHIVTPLRDLCPHARVIQGVVDSVDPDEVSVTIDGPLGSGRRTISGDVLVMALGAVPADFGIEVDWIEGWEHVIRKTGSE